MVRPLSSLVKANLMALLLLVALALAGLGLSLSYRWSERAGLERLAELAVERGELYAGALEGELGRLAHLPSLVGLSAEVQALFEAPTPASLESAQRRLAQINARAGSLLIFLVDAEGRWLGSSAALAPSVIERARLEQIAGALDAGRHGFFAAPDGSTDYFHAAPLQRAGRRLGLVVVRINLAPLEATWVDLGVRSRSERLLVLDRNDVVVMSSVPEWKYLRLVAGLETANWSRLPAADGVHYPPQALQALRWAEREGSARGAPLLRLRPPQGQEQLLLAQERPMLTLGLRLLTLSDPGEVWREARRASWGGAALGALAGLLAAYVLYRRRALAQLLRARNALARSRDELEQQVALRTQELSDANAELKRQIEQRVRAEDELVQAGKLAVLGQMSAGLAHEINQPLTAVRALSGNTLRLLDAGRLDAVRRNLQNIEVGVDRMGRISSQLKSFARRASGRGEPVRLRAAVDNALALLEHRLREAGVRPQLDLDEGLSVRCDGTRLEQVLLNLVGNAIDALENLPPQAERRLRIAARRVGARVQIEVEDSGGGLSPEAQARLFEPFFTTKPAGQGLGLGLVISSQIVQEFGGSLQPEPCGGGLRFRFDLQALDDMPKESADV